MKTFEDFQREKVKLAAVLLNKLVEMHPKLSAAEQLGKKELVEGWLRVYIKNVRGLLELAEDQRKLCTSQQCNVLLDQEITALSERDGAIAHLTSVLQGAVLDEAKVRNVLVMIASRADALNMLKRAA